VHVHDDGRAVGVQAQRRGVDATLRADAEELAQPPTERLRSRRDQAFRVAALVPDDDGAVAFEDRPGLYGLRGGQPDGNPADVAEQVLPLRPDLAVPASAVARARHTRHFSRQ
jgi:hypothetical protein